jgi:predicted secreted protein
VKTDASGNLIWSKTYGGAENDYGYCVVETSDGYALAGNTASSGAGGVDCWLVKTDASGTLQWSKTYGGTSSESAYCVVQTSDGGYALAGSKYSTTSGYNFLLVKTDASGNELWSKTYGGTQNDNGECVVETSDGGYAIAGTTASSGAGGADAWLVRTDASGNMLWSQTYGGSSYDYGSCVVQTHDGSYALTGLTLSSGLGGGDVWLIKTAPDSLFVVPEYAFGAAGALIACIAAMAIIAINKKRQNK